MSSTSLRKTTNNNNNKKIDTHRSNNANNTKSRSQSKSPLNASTPKVNYSQTNIPLQSSNTKSVQKCKFDSEMFVLQKDLKNNKNKLSSCLQMFSMLEGSNQSHRCLQHNNLLSLYCLNERRILCVNCLYGMHRHRSHKVVPLKDSMNEVYDDNHKLSLIIEEEIKKMDYYSKMAQENANIIDSEMKRIISEMQTEYIAKIEQIKYKFQKSKLSLIQSFAPIVQKCRGVKSAFEDFRFNVWKAFTLYNDQKATDDNEVMRQTLFVKIIELCQFKNRPITRNELQGLSRRLKEHF